MTTTRRAAGVTVLVAVAAVAAVLTCTAWAGGPAPGAAALAAPPQFGVSGTSVLRLSSHPEERDEAFRVVRDLGAGWLRVDVQWDTIEARKGRYTWAVLDRFVDGARASGQKVLALVQRTPAWARPSGSKGTYPPVGTGPLGAYATFMRTLAQRYTQPGSVRIHAVEVWNEPNWAPFWGGPIMASRYVDLLRRAHPALKAVNKATTVVTGGLAPAFDTSTSVSPRTFLKRMYAAGARPYFDAVAMHPYSYPTFPSQTGPYGWGNLTKPYKGTPSLRATMDTNGDAAKKIWVTEYGSPAETVGEDGQAALATDAVQVWTSYPWAGPFFYFSLHPVSTTVRDASMSLVRADGTHRPVFDALRSAIWVAQHPGETTTTSSTSSSTTESTTTRPPSRRRPPRSRRRPPPRTTVPGG